MMDYKIYYRYDIQRNPYETVFSWFLDEDDARELLGISEQFTALQMGWA